MLTLTLLFVTTSSFAQSAATLEAVRLHKPGALDLARAELKACLASPPTTASNDPDAGATEPAEPARGCERLAHLSLLNGYLLLSDGLPAEAARQILSQPPPERLEAVYYLYLGGSLFYAGEKLAAAQAYEKGLQTAPRHLAPRLKARRAEALLAAGDAAQAAPILERSAPELASPELYWQRASARRLTGNLNGETADLKLLAVRHPAHPYGIEAFDRLVAGNAWKPSFEERLARARGLIDAGEPKAAVAELDAAQTHGLIKGASARARASLVRAQALYAAGDEKAAEQAVGDAMKGQNAIASEALMLKARRTLRADNAKGKKLLLEVVRRFPRERAADDAAFLVGWVDLQSGQYADAAAEFTDFEKKFRSSRKRDEALWFHSLALMRLKRWDQAQATLQQLVNDYPRSSMVPQARYWWTRCEQLKLESPRVKSPRLPDALAQRYQDLIAQFPGSFYAQLAAERLSAAGKTPPPFFPSRPKPLDLSVPAELSQVARLASVGLFRDATEEAMSIAYQTRSAEQALRMGHGLHQIGEYGVAHMLASRLLWGQAFTHKDPSALALMYPRAFFKAVEREARDYGVDPYLLLAIMRRESTFRPHLVSAADARGLMQIIPPTATAIAAELGIRNPEPDQLYSPDLNLQLAAWYLSALEKRFKHPALIAAAYNAGPPAVSKWAKRSEEELPLDLWIELIPFKETRGYVKHVTADYLLYRFFYADERKKKPNRLTLSVPEVSADGVDF